VGTPAVELLHGYGEHANPACEGDTQFDEISQDVGVFPGEEPDGGGQRDAVTDGLQANHGGENQDDKAQSGLHAGTTQRKSPYPANRACCSEQPSHTPGMLAKSIAAKTETAQPET
jgi:hypothetical protein